ncbi:hypothetical protein Barb4_02441 [Bacteroidales bacterium Barb4]|nr:hypothetical protein Barb4_02441 [Bacteroidales bacterium Barb4]
MSATASSISGSSIRAGMAVIPLLLSSALFRPVHNLFSATRALTIYSPVLPRLPGLTPLNFLPSRQICFSDSSPIKSLPRFDAANPAPGRRRHG